MTNRPLCLTAKGFLYDTVKVILSPLGHNPVLDQVFEYIKTYEIRAGRGTDLCLCLFRAIAPRRLLSIAHKMSRDSASSSLFEGDLFSGFMLAVGLVSFKLYFESMWDEMAQQRHLPLRM